MLAMTVARQSDGRPLLRTGTTEIVDSTRILKNVEHWWQNPGWCWPNPLTAILPVVGLYRSSGSDSDPPPGLLLSASTRASFTLRAGLRGLSASRLLFMKGSAGDDGYHDGDAKVEYILRCALPSQRDSSSGRLQWPHIFHRHYMPANPFLSGGPVLPPTPGCECEMSVCLHPWFPDKDRCCLHRWGLCWYLR